MDKSKAARNPPPSFSRPWIERFPYEALASREHRPEVADADLRLFMPTGCVVAYVDEQLRTHVMEARAYGSTTGGRKLLVGFQTDGALVSEQIWKAVERYDRIFVIERDVQFVERTIPSHHGSRFTEILALAPETGLDLTNHDAKGY